MAGLAHAGGSRRRHLGDGGIIVSPTGRQADRIDGGDAEKGIRIGTSCLDHGLPRFPSAVIQESPKGAGAEEGGDTLFGERLR